MSSRQRQFKQSLPRQVLSVKAVNEHQLVECYLAKAFHLAERFNIRLMYGGGRGPAKPVQFTGFRLYSKEGLQLPEVTPGLIKL